MTSLSGRVALVAGATRGAGRGIAVALGAQGATVYCTGRSTRGNPASGTRPETIEETAELVTSAGGQGIWARVDHTVESDVAALIERVRREQGKLDILVNDVWGGESLVEFGTPFWELSIDKFRTLFDRAVMSHVITSRHAVPLMIDSGGTLIVEVTDGNTFTYRGNLAYDLVKTSVIRLAFALATELREKNIAAVAVTPGFLRSEEMLDLFGVKEENWRDGVQKDPHFIASETPAFVGRAIAALAADADILRKSGRVFSSWDLSDEYGFTDAGGARPHWGKYWEQTFGAPLEVCDDAFYAYWQGSRSG